MSVTKARNPKPTAAVDLECPSVSAETAVGLRVYTISNRRVKSLDDLPDECFGPYWMLPRHTISYNMYVYVYVYGSESKNSAL